LPYQDLSQRTHWRSLPAEIRREFQVVAYFWILYIYIILKSDM
jgi:hypothetical protein